MVQIMTKTFYRRDQVMVGVVGMDRAAGRTWVGRAYQRPSPEICARRSLLSLPQQMSPCPGMLRTREWQLR